MQQESVALEEGEHMAKNKTLEAIVRIAGQVDPSLQKSLQNVQKEFGGLKIGIAAIGTAAVATSALIVKLGADSTKAATVFEQQMANVATLLDGTKEQVSERINELGDDVVKVSNSTGVVTGELTDGLYQIISAVGDSEDAIIQMELAAKAAKAGGAETTDAINLLTAVTKGYNDTSGEAFQKASDLAFETVKLGQTSFPELASSIGKVIPLASALGVEQEELFGSFAALTGVTGSTAEVATQMKSVMSGLMQPTEQMTEALEVLGFASADAALETLGFDGLLLSLKSAMDEDVQATAKLFSSVEAQTAILALAGAQSEDLTNKTWSMYEAAGATDRAFEAQTDTLEYTLEAIRNVGKNFMLTVGRTILPTVHELTDKALSKIETFLTDATPKVIDLFSKAITYGSSVFGFIKNNIIPIVKEVGSVVGVAIGAAIDIIQKVYNTTQSVFNYLSEHKTVLSVVAIAIGTITAAIGAYMLVSNAATIAWGVLSAAITVYTTVTTIATTISSAFGAVMAFITSPITLVVLAIGAVIAAGVALYQNWEVVKEKASIICEHLKTFANGIKEGFVNAFSGLVGIVAQPINSIISLVNNAINAINELSITIPDWVPLLGGKSFKLDIPPIPMFASGGFTSGPSIAGEVGTEAVISFDSAYRSENLSYWAKAGRMLGVDDSLFTSFETGSQSSGDSISFTFAPQITIQGTGNAKEDIIQALKNEEEEFMDLVEEMLSRRGSGSYVYG